MNKGHSALVFGILAVALLFAGCVKQGGVGANAANATPSPSLTAAEQELLKYPELAGYIQSYQQLGQPAKRPDYLPSIVFSKLPPLPRDFYVVRLMINLGKFTDMNTISEGYWKQPEFYPNFEMQAVKLYQHPDTGRWTAWGVGAYPTEVVVQSPRTADVNLAFFMYSGWTVQMYQGLKFNYGFPKTAQLIYSQFPDNSKNVTQDPDKVKQYFDVQITPQEILLEPNFPVFEKDWTQKISVKLHVKNAAPGKYAIGIGSGAPNQAQTNAWVAKYLNRYTDATSGMADVGRPWYSIFIDIT